MDCSTPGFPVHHQLLEIAQTHVHQVSDAIQSSHPLSSPFPPASIVPSIRVFSSESVLCIRWPKYWSPSIIPSKEIPGLISFRIDWLDLLAVQGTFKSLLQHHSSKASVLRCSAFLCYCVNYVLYCTTYYVNVNTLFNININVSYILHCFYLKISFSFNALKIELNFCSKQYGRDSSRE